MNIGIYFHIMGLVLAGGACVAIGKTAMVWRGPFRDELMLIATGFGVFGTAFFWQILKNIGTPEAMFLGNMADFLFLIAIAPLAIGASAIFTFTEVPSGESTKQQKTP